MDNLFNNILSSEESLFLNPQFLDTDYQPKLVPFREMQQKHIASCIKPLLSRRNGKNVIVHGMPGVGKTVCLKHVLNELKEEYSSEVCCLYVNCWKKDTSFKIVTSICEQLNYKWIHNKTFDELIKHIAKILNEKSAVIVLDEVDKLQDENIIYSILEDIYRKSLILITNDNHFLVRLDSRVRSRLIPDVLEFKPYNKQEVFEILKQRAEYAFVPSSLDKAVFDRVVEKTSESSDIRVGLFLLKQSAENAENKSSRIISMEYLNEAMELLSVENLNTREDSLIEIIKENSGKPTSEIFRLYEKKEGKSIRTFQRKLKDLEKENKIRLREENKGFDGKKIFVDMN